MGDNSTARQLVDAVIADFPDHATGTRPVHTVGIGVLGSFLASEVASDYCCAAHFAGAAIPVTVRFSNGSGSPTEHDSWSDVRGMAARFHLPDGSATDLIAMTLREFFVRTPDDFLDFCRSARQTPAVAESPWRKILDLIQLKQPMPDPMPGQHGSGVAGSLMYANHHRAAQLAVFDAGNIGAPASYFQATYNAVHTFIISAADGQRRYVRFTWQPVAGVKVIDPTAPPVDRYLQQDVRDRLAAWPVQFLLLMTIGEGGDAFDDPTIPWTPTRIRVVMGTLTLTAVAPDQEQDCERIAFNPCRLTPGIAVSNDPILAARRDAYEVSRELRGGTPCPFGPPKP